MRQRPRRNRRSAAIRGFVRATHLGPEHLVLPAFVHESDAPHPIASMPGHSRLGIGDMVALGKEAASLGIHGLALLPAFDDSKNDARGSVAENENGLLQRTISALKREVPEVVIFSDVALDPYSSDGHDGVVVGDKIDNELTVPILARMAVAQARAGADFVAPSDMMDGRVEAIRRALDDAGFYEVGIMSYAVKYAIGRASW